MSGFKSGKKYADLLTVLLVIIIIAIIGMLGYFGYKIISKKSIEDTKDKALAEFENSLPAPVIPDSKKKEEDDGNNSTEAPDLSGLITETPQEPVEQKRNPKKTYLDGYEIKGAIKIDKTGCNYPILEKVTPNSLAKSVAILDVQTHSEVAYTGNDLNIPGTNVLILGHNYRNGLFFSNNDRLSVGDKIKITDQLGETVTYTIYEMYYTTPSDVSFMRRDLDKNSREITLQTCNDDSSQRLIIQARDN